MHAPVAAPAPSPLAPGQRFGTYVIETCQGQGGMGAVYRARDTKLGRTVALKVIRAGGEGTGRESAPAADIIARFLREARLGAALAHPNIAVVFEAGAIGDQPYLAMEWVDGAPLALRMGDERLSVAARAEILDAVADALAYAHAQGVIHRDVKPSNVMVDARGRARLVDFGIAKPTQLAVEPGTMMLPTHARVVLGTPAYMAPEQMLSPSVDPRADQFSWGVMAYEVLSGTHPAETVPEGGTAFPAAKPKPLGWLRPEVGDALAAVVHRAMSYEPGARFSSMDELLHAWRTARGATAGVAGVTGAAAAAAGGLGPSTGPGAGGSYGPPAQAASYPPRSPYDAGFGNMSTVGRTSASAPPAAAPPFAPTLDTTARGVVGTVPLAHPAGGYPSPPTPARGFPWIALVAIGAGLLGMAGIATAIVVTGHGPAGLASPASSGGGGITLPSVSLGPKTAVVESMDDLKSTAPPAEVAKAKAALEAKITSCFDSSVAKGLMFKTEVVVAADGRVTKTIEMNVCKEQHPSFYLCTERGKTPKKGFPTATEEVFGCIDRAVTGTRFPKPTVDPDEKTVEVTLHVDVR